MSKCNILKATLAVVDTNITLTLPNTTEPLKNRDCLRFYITATIPEDNPLGAVAIIINGIEAPLVTVLGNNVRIEQLRNRFVYSVQFGAQTPVFVMKTCLPDTSYVYPAYAAPEA